MIKQRNIEREPSRFSQIWDESPISRESLDELYPYARLVMGILFVVIAALSTIFGVAADVYAPLVQHRQAIETMTNVSISMWSYMIGIVVAVLIFVGEVLTGERHKLVYALFLVPDVYYTYPWSAVIASAILPSAGATITVPLVGILIAAIIAHYGETLLFGKRR